MTHAEVLSAPISRRNLKVVVLSALPLWHSDCSGPLFQVMSLQTLVASRKTVFPSSLTVCKVTVPFSC
jgi:hypothetical protein